MRALLFALAVLGLPHAGCLVGYESRPLDGLVQVDAGNGLAGGAVDPDGGAVTDTTRDAATPEVPVDGGPDGGASDVAIPERDSDGDGWFDSDEVACGSAPGLPESAPLDADGNGTADCLEGPLGEPVALFPFAGSPEDIGPNRIALTPVASGPVLAQDRHGTANSAYAFSAATCDRFVNGESESPLAVDNELTVSVWVRPIDSSPIQKVVGRAYRGNGDVFRGWVVGIGDGRLNPEIWDTEGNRYIFSRGGVPSGIWTHLAITWRTGGKLRGYVDGILAAEVDAGDLPIGDDPGASFRVGARPWANVDWCFDGSIDDIRVYDRELSSAQIAVLAH